MFVCSSQLQDKQLSIHLVGYTHFLAIVLLCANVLSQPTQASRTNASHYCLSRRPIKLLRFTVSIFFEMLYISSLAMFSVAFDCKVIHEDHAHWEVRVLVM